VPKVDFGISAGILAASYGAIGAAQLAKVLATPLPEFAEGGYTKKGGKYEPAGIVHAGEYVIPKFMVDNNNFAPLINYLETSRKRGYATGGMVENKSNINNIINNTQTIQQPKIVVSVESIDSVKNDVIRAQSLATL
jgi:hypothetical protein